MPNSLSCHLLENYVFPLTVIPNAGEEKEIKWQACSTLLFSKAEAYFWDLSENQGRCD